MFYLRDPYYVEEVPKEQRHLFRSEGEFEAEVIHSSIHLMSEINISERPYYTKRLS